MSNSSALATLGGFRFHSFFNFSYNAKASFNLESIVVELVIWKLPRMDRIEMHEVLMYASDE